MVFELLAQKTQQQPADVVAPLAQRRQLELETRQPVKKRRLEPARGDRLFEGGIGSGDQPHIDPPPLIGSHRLDFTLLEGPQQVRLQLDARLADFVEEKGASAGPRKKSFARAVGSGIGPFDRTKQFGRGQAGRHRREVDGNKRAPPPTRLVDGFGYQLLAAAGFPAQEDRHTGSRHLVQFAQHPFEGRAFAHQVESLQSGRLWIDLAQKQGDPFTEFEHHPARERGGVHGKIAGEGLPIDPDPRPRLTAQGHPTGCSGGEKKRRAAEVGIGQGFGAGNAGAGEVGLEARQGDVLAAEQRGERKTFAHPRHIGVAQHGEPGDTHLSQRLPDRGNIPCFGVETARFAPLCRRAVRLVGTHIRSIPARPIGLHPPTRPVHFRRPNPGAANPVE